MKKFFIITFFIIINLFYTSILFAERLKINLQCDITLDGEFLSTKTFELDSTKSGGFLSYYDESIVEFNETIPLDSTNDKFRIMYYHIDRFSGSGQVLVSNQVNADQFLKYYNKIKKLQGINKRNVHYHLKQGMDDSLTGRAQCFSAKKSF